MISFDVIFDFFRAVMNYFVQSSYVADEPHRPHIYVKYGTKTTVPVHLGSDWTIRDLKRFVCSKLNLDPAHLRIIFAGKELNDEINLQECDVGEHTIIHAVSQKSKSICVTVEEKCPLNKTLFCSNENESSTPASKQSHFFVYCNDPCKKLCQGKLRVCCSLCKEGTLTVDRDPTCWDDVLIAGRISGRCHSENCSGQNAQFYFMCAQHVSPSRERAVPLYLIKNNCKNVPCIACTDVSTPILVFPCQDGHVICLDCFRTYCLSRLSERQFIQDETIGYSINCPAGCPDSLIKEPHHFKLLDEDQYNRYQRFAAEECLLQAGGVVCPQPNCGAGILPPVDDCNRIVCVAEGIGGCGFVFCKQCMQGYHIGPCVQSDAYGVVSESNFSISDERASSSKWDEYSRSTIQSTTKPCPGCRTPTERDGGCMHMVCTRAQCGLHWCWICQEEWSRECMGNHWFG